MKRLAKEISTDVSVGRAADYSPDPDIIDVLFAQHELRAQHGPPVLYM